VQSAFALPFRSLRFIIHAMMPRCQRGMSSTDMRENYCTHESGIPGFWQEQESVG
jgi:hypothetical protein